MSIESGIVVELVLGIRISMAELAKLSNLSVPSGFHRKERQVYVMHTTLYMMEVLML